jgi:hypothetical protein
MSAFYCQVCTYRYQYMTSLRMEWYRTRSVTTQKVATLCSIHNDFVQTLLLPLMVENCAA